jgi:hypothetical protein
MIDYDWVEGNLLGNYLYYEKPTGRIVGEVSRVGMTGTRTSATTFVIIGKEEYLGNYIDSKYAKNAVERFIQRHNNIIDGNLLESET